jgi:hypothetical protein
MACKGKLKKYRKINATYVIASHQASRWKLIDDAKQSFRYSKLVRFTSRKTILNRFCSAEWWTLFVEAGTLSLAMTRLRTFFAIVIFQPDLLQGAQE